MIDNITRIILLGLFGLFYYFMWTHPEITLDPPLQPCIFEEQ